MKSKNVSPLPQFILIFSVADKIIFWKTLRWKNKFLWYLHLLKEHSKRANYNMDYRKIDMDNVFRPS